MDRQRKNLVISLAFSLLMHLVFAQDRIDKKCNPNIRHRFEDCPKGYCCVRDEFLPTYVYCRKIGALDENCTTRDTDSECPCAQGLYCKANIVSSFVSLYGRCYKHVTTTTTSGTTTTTMAALSSSDTTDTFPLTDAGTASMKSDTPMTSATTTGGSPTTGDVFQKAVVTTTSHNTPTTRPVIKFPMPIIG